MMVERALHVVSDSGGADGPKAGKGSGFTAGELTGAGLVLKAATRALVSSCGGGEGAAATIEAATGRHARQQRMSACGSANAPDFLRIDEVDVLEDAARRDGQWPAVTRAMAARRGFRLVPVRAAMSSGREIHALLSALYRESGEAGAMIAEAIADGHVAEDEARACLCEVAQMEQAAAEMRAALEAVLA